MIIILVNWNNELKIIQQFLKEELVIEQIPLNLTQFQQKAEKKRENNIHVQQGNKDSQISIY